MKKLSKNCWWSEHKDFLTMIRYSQYNIEAINAEDGCDVSEAIENDQATFEACSLGVQPWRYYGHT